MRTITPDDLFAFRLAGDIQVSPNPEPLIVYVESQADPETNTYKRQLMAVRPGQDPLSFSAGPTDTHPRFSPDGQWVGFLSERSGQSQIWLLSTAGGEASQLTRIEGGVRDFIWAPDSQNLFLTASLTKDGVQPETKANPEKEEPRIRFNRDVKVITELAHKLDGTGYFTEKRPHVVQVSIKNPDSPRQLTFGPYRHSGLAINPDGTKLLVQSRYGDDYDREWAGGILYLLDLSAEAPPDPVAITSPDLSVNQARFSPDGSQVLYTASRQDQMGYDTSRLYVYDLKTKATTPIAHEWDRPLTDLSLSDLSGTGSNPHLFTPNGEALYTLTSRNGATHLAQIHLKTHQVTLITKEDAVYYSYDLDQSRTHAALIKSTPTNPSEVVWLDLAVGDYQTLSNPNQKLLAELKLAEPSRFITRANGGPEVDGWVMKPSAYEAGQRYPAILEIHGGPMMLYAQSFFFEFQCLAAAGYGVIYTNPRGSQGYGTEFCTAIQKEWGHLDYLDIMAGLETALNRESWIDPNRLGVAGGSYGGYMTNWIVSHTDRFQAAVTMRSVVDWRAMVGTGDGGWHWMKRADQKAPWQDDAWYRQQSPITYVENIRTPLLIEHQEGDLRCPIEQGEILYTAVKYLNQAPVKFVRYPDEFHGMSRDGKPWHRIHRLQTMTDWLHTYIRERED